MKLLNNLHKLLKIRIFECESVQRSLDINDLNWYEKIHFGDR